MAVHALSCRMARPELLLNPTKIQAKRRRGLTAEALGFFYVEIESEDSYV
jgi:hypothetical protein